MMLEAFDKIAVWLEQIDDDEKAQEDFYSYTLGYSFEDVAILLDLTKEFYKKRIEEAKNS